MWGSFEIKNVQLIQKMLRQYHYSLLPPLNDTNVINTPFISATELENNDINNSEYKNKIIRKITKDNIEIIAEDFEQLPFQFMNFHGGSSLIDVLDAMDYAVYKYDIQHIILDNLQFMMPSAKSELFTNKLNIDDKLKSNIKDNNYNTKYSNTNKYTTIGTNMKSYNNIDKFESQDIAIEAFRKFATINNVNVILVIHPRKEDDRNALSNFYLFIF